MIGLTVGPRKQFEMRLWASVGIFCPVLIHVWLTGCTLNFSSLHTSNSHKKRSGFMSPTDIKDIKSKLKAIKETEEKM